MSESEAMEREANRRAHRIARLVLKERQQDMALLEVKAKKVSEIGAQLAIRLKWNSDLGRALDAYEEIEERQQKEATL